MTTTSLKRTARSDAKRLHQRATYDRRTVNAIIDATPMCHVGYVIEGLPYVTPTLQWREDDRLFWHGSSASRMLRQVDRQPVCITITHLDGFVLARSAFHHSVKRLIPLAPAAPDVVTQS